MRKCSYCQQEKPLEQFHRNASDKLGRGYTCKPCSKQRERRRATQRRPWTLADLMRARSRFARYVERDDAATCWAWTGGRTTRGYGCFNLLRHTLLAHRVAFMLEHERMLVTEQFVMHSCDNPCCVNPAHLILGSHAENMEDMTAKGRSTRGERNPQAKLTDADVRRIRRLADDGYYSHREIADMWGVHRALVGYIAQRKIWTHVA